MKQTNNAIKFLVAQYRAIFKNAYFKGMASAALLTAALIAGQANAATTDGKWDSADFINDSSSANDIPAGETLTGSLGKIDVKDLVSGGVDKDGYAYTGTTKFTNASIELQGVAGHHLAISGSLTLEKTNFTLKNTNNTDTEIVGYHETAKKHNGELNITNGSNVNLERASFSFGDIKLTSGSTITLGGIQSIRDDANKKKGNAEFNIYSIFGANQCSNGGSGTLTVSNSIINLKNQSLVNGAQVNISGESVINFEGTPVTESIKNSNKTEKADTYSSALIRAFSGSNTSDYSVKINANKMTGTSEAAEVDKAKWDKPVLNVLDGKTGAIYAETIKFDGVDVKVGKGATFTLDGDFTNKVFGTEVKNSYHKASTITLSDVTVNNQGTLVLGNKRNAGKTDVVNTNASDNNNAIKALDSKTVINGTLENNTALLVNGSGSTSLTVDESMIFVTKDKDNKITNTTGLFANGIGSVTLTSGGVLALANGDLEKGVDLNKDVTFADTGVTNTGKPNDGLAPAGTVLVKDKGTIQGGYLKVATAIENLGAGQLSLAADKLEIGNNSKDSKAKLSDFNLAGLEVIGKEKAELILDGNDSGDVLTVDKTIKAYVQDYFIKDEKNVCSPYAVNPLVGKIKGDDLLVSGGTLRIAGGNWENEGQRLTLTNDVEYLAPALSVTAQLTDDYTAADASGSATIDNQTTSYLKHVNPSYLTWHGDFILSGNYYAGLVQIVGINGANATLDLTQADVTWGEGIVNVGSTKFVTPSYNLSNVIDDNLEHKNGYGILKLDRDEFADFLAKPTAEIPTKSSIHLFDEGVLYVESDFNTINFDQLATAEASTITKNTNPGTILFVTNTGSAVGGISPVYTNYLYHTGNLILETGLQANGEAEPEDGQTGKKLNIGQGSIYATNISIDNYSLADKAQDGGDRVTVATGTLAVAESLRSDNAKVVFGDPDVQDTKAKLILGFNANTFAQDNTGTVDTNLEFNNSSSLEVQNGAWTVNEDITLNGGSSIMVLTGAKVKDKQIVNSLRADNLAITEAGSLTVNPLAQAQFNTIQAHSGASIDVTGRVLVNGLVINEVSDPEIDPNLDPAYATRATNGVDLTDATIKVTGAGAVFEFGATATDGLLDNTGVLTLKEGGITGTQWSVSNFGQVKFDFANFTDKTINPDDIKVLVDNILGTSNTTGYLNLANAELGMTITDRASAPGYYEAKWTDNVELYKQVVGHATTDKLLNTVVQIEDDQAKIRGHYAALEVTDKVDNSFGKVRLDGPTSLHHSDANGGNFVSFNGDVGSVELDKDASLALFGSGTIGSIESRYKDGGDSIDWDGDVVENARGSLFISNEGDVSSSAVDVKGSIKGINRLDISTGAQVTVDENIENTNAVELADNSSLTVKGDLQSSRLNVDSSSSVQATNTQILGGLVMGKSTNNETLTLGDKNRSGDLEIYGGEVKTKDLVFSTLSGANDHRSIDVGTGINDKDFDDPDTIYNEQIGYTGSLEVTGKTTLNHRGEISVVAENTAKGGVSFASLNDLSGKDTTENYAGTLDGGLFVGQNGVAGIGVKDMASLKGELARFFDGNALTQANAQSILYLGKAFNVGQDEHVVLTSMQTEPFIEHITKNNKETNPKIDFSNCDGDFFGPNTFYMGENTAVVVAKNLADAARITSLGDAGATKAMISFVGDKVDAQGTVIADGGDIFINGDVRAAKYQVFSTNATIEYLDGTDYKIALEGEDNYANNINVTTENGFLNGFVDVDGTVALKVDPNGRAIMSGASDPVFDTIVAYARGYYGPEIADTTPPVPPTEGEDGKGTKAATESPVTPPATTAEREYIYSLDKDGNKLIGQYANYFLQETIATGEGSAAETVARLGVFGGMSQTAIAVAGTSSDAMAARMGIGGKNTQLSVADNGQGASLWVAPIYKSYNSDTFAIQSLNYGVDIDMYGLALGGDYSLGNGMKFGAMFNLGSGDTEGNGAATGTTNDFNYYGFGAFFGYSIDQFSVMADASYTIVDNDLEANTAIEKVSSSADASTYSIGVTAQYTIDMAGFEIAPHIGARYSSIDLDDYIIKGASGDIALYEAEKINVFSIPVGVSFAKEIVSESWTVKPSLDLTVTVNAGDDTADGNVYWAGAENLRTTGLKSEILDSVTYGATAGFSAKSGNFSLGLGVSYTGSSNTDELGVNANARFMF